MSLYDWRLELHSQLTDHAFVQDPDDIPGGCLTCWTRLSEALDE